MHKHKKGATKNIEDLEFKVKMIFLKEKKKKKVPYFLAEQDIRKVQQNIRFAQK